MKSLKFVAVAAFCALAALAQADTFARQTAPESSCAFGPTVTASASGALNG